MITYNQASTADDIVPFIKKYGHGSMSYSALQHGMRWFVLPDYGFIQYEPTETMLHRAVVLGDPICAPEHRERMLGAFLKEFPNPVFIHITKECGITLQQFGFYINHMGDETVVDLADFTLSGSKKEFLRSQKNRATKDGVVVQEIGSGCAVSAADLKAVSEEWLQHKAVHDHELAFLVRPAVFEDEFDVRKFIALKNGKVMGFVFFDPMYRDGKVYGYIANILRSLSDQSYSITDFIIIEAINKFKEEGIESLSLGLCPFHGITDDEGFNYSPPLAALFKYSYEHANYLYSFKSLAFHKERYRPDQPGAHNIKLYAGTKLQMPLITLYGIFRKMGIHPTRQTAEHAVHAAEEIAKKIPEEFRKLIQHWKQPHQENETAQ